MTRTKLRVMCIVCPAVSLAVGAGLVRYEYAHLARERRELAAGTTEIRRLQSRIVELRGSGAAAAALGHTHSGHKD